MVTIPLTRNLFAYVDDEDADLSNLHWSSDAKGYAQRFYGNRTTIKMHRVIMERILLRPIERHEQVDHINRNKSDNRRANLRLANHHQNSANQAREGKTKGVQQVQKSENGAIRWRARIRCHGCLAHLGYFATEAEAVAAYNQAALELFGEFAAPVS